MSILTKQSRAMWLSAALLLTSAASAFADIAADDAAPEGFEPVFNGENLDNWKGGSTADPRKISDEQQAKWDDAIEDHWSVENGEIVNDGHEPHLVTNKDYGDFEMWVDWKLSPNGDSGVYLRGVPQVQLWDPENEAAHQHGSDKGSGGLWNNQTHERFPTTVADKPTGEWNRMYIRMVGQFVTVKLNGELVVDNVPLENYFDRDMPVFMTGPIHLQTHGSETRFRRVLVREIPASEANKILAEIGSGQGEFKTLLDSDDLSGWVGAKQDYEVEDGVLKTIPGRGGNLFTEDKYEDFVLQFEFQLPPGGNSGVALRMEGAEGDPAYSGIELQILDNTAEMYANLKPYQYHGSAYGLVPAKRGFLRPVGEWNYEEVRVKGDQIQVSVNGFTILDADIAEASEQPADGNKHPGATRAAGHVGFCGHNDPVKFRNVRIKSL